jgi:hypothetical protein
MLCYLQICFNICWGKAWSIEDSNKENKEINLNPDFYETVTVKIPKAIMELLRHSESITGDTPTQDIEYAAVESVRSRIDSGQFLPTRQALADQYNFNPCLKRFSTIPLRIRLLIIKLFFSFFQLRTYSMIF